MSEETKLKLCKCGCNKYFPSTLKFFNKKKTSADKLQPYSIECSKRLLKERRINKECITEGLKQCIGCNKWFPRSSQYWNKNSGNKDGWQSYHIECHKNRDIIRRNKHKERHTFSPPEKEGFKKCGCCGKIFHLSKFSYNRGTSDGFMSISIPCQIAKNNQRRRQDRGRYTPKEFLALLIYYNYTCAYCGCDISENYVREHFHALEAEEGSPKGTNRIDNMLPSCPGCNGSKGNKNPYKWIMQTFGIHHPLMHFDGFTIEDLISLLREPISSISFRISSFL